jgi:cysteine synthase
VPLPEVTSEATEFVKKTNASHSVVVWSLEYCEFCWTIFQLFEALGISETQADSEAQGYHRVDIDAFKFAKDNMGNKYRAALAEMSGVNTFPQIFIGGEFVGGAVDACIMWKKGELAPLLEKAGIEVKQSSEGGHAYKGDPFEFLPKWMSQNPFRST